MSNWEIPQGYLSAVSVTSTPVTSSTFDHLRVADTHFMEVETSSYSGDTELIVWFQGSLDGTNWFTILQVLPAANGTTFAGPGVVPCRYTRLYAVAQDGSTSATVSVTAVSGLS